MPEYTVRPSQPLRLDRPVDTIKPLGNEVRVAGPSIEEEVISAATTTTLDVEGAAGLMLTSTKTARVEVTYADEAEAEAEAA